MYAQGIPPIPEPNPHRKIDQARLRDIRKRLEGLCTTRDLDSIFYEIIDDAVELSSGNLLNLIISFIRLYWKRCHSKSG